MIEVSNVSFGFKDQIIFENLSQKFLNGTTYAICGKSGSGKSTLISLLGGLIKPNLGIIDIDGIDICQVNSSTIQKMKRDKIGFILQNYLLINDETVKKNLMYACKIKNNYNINESLKVVDLNDKENHYIYQLSGGEQQRVAIARLLIQNLQIILADEPTGSLDNLIGIQIMDYLKTYIKDTGGILIVVTHDEQVALMCDERITL